MLLKMSIFHSFYGTTSFYAFLANGTATCTILDTWGWCTGTTQRDGMVREEGGGFRMGNTCSQLAKVLEFQLQSFQKVFRVDFF